MKKHLSLVMFLVSSPLKVLYEYEIPVFTNGPIFPIPSGFETVKQFSSAQSPGWSVLRKASIKTNSLIVKKNQHNTNSNPEQREIGLSSVLRTAGFQSPAEVNIDIHVKFESLYRVGSKNWPVR